MIKAYVTFNGSYGCIPDNSVAFTSRKAACDYLIDLFEIKGTLKAGELRRAGYIDLGPDYGADYCEIEKLEGEAAISALTEHY